MVIFPEQARRAVGYALEEAEFFDGLSRADAQRYAQAFDAMPDTLLVSLARQMKTMKKEVER